MDTYIGVITPDGVVESGRRKISLAGIEVKEYGFSRAVWQLCPEGWKKPLGDDWEDVLSIIIRKWSPETYLVKERTMKEESDFHSQFAAQASSLSRRIYKAHGVDVSRLQELNCIYMVYLEKGSVVSKVSPGQWQLLESIGVDLTMC